MKTYEKSSELRVLRILDIVSNIIDCANGLDDGCDSCDEGDDGCDDKWDDSCYNHGNVTSVNPIWFLG